MANQDEQTKFDQTELCDSERCYRILNSKLNLIAKKLEEKGVFTKEDVREIQSLSPFTEDLA